MSIKKTLVVSALFTTLVWLVFAWPLPRYVTRGIPASSTNVEKDGVRMMLPGDHLQFHYFHWLFSDMLAGTTPWFHNLYEFNTGDDAARRRPGTYNLPLSLVYVAGRALGGRALGWNLMGWVSLWLTYLVTWLLLRRFTTREWAAAAFALISITLPYRWITLCGGSPTGFAMMWVPLLVYGLDRAARDGSLAGGAWAAAALAGTYLNDRHIFFFGMATSPLWVLLGLLRRDRPPWHSRHTLGTLLKAAVPFALAFVTLAGVAFASKQTRFAGTNLASGRGVAEIVKFSPQPRGLVLWRLNGTDAHAFIGIVIPLLLLAHIGLLVWMRRRGRCSAPRFTAGLLLHTAAAVTVILCLGPHGPFGGEAFALAREWLPAFNMIRQSDKIFCLLPTLFAMAAVWAVTDLAPVLRRARWVPALVAALFLAEYTAQVRTTVCLLDPDQAAYAAVADDAAQRGDTARALIVPLWPGDSSWASLYEHYVSLYRIRMLNGYTPVVSDTYRTLADRFSGANLGLLPDARLDELTARGFGYVILHANAFPEQVSPYPVYFTLKRLLAHPRLSLLAQDGDVWSFRIEPQPAPRSVRDLEPTVYFPARFRHWELENLPHSGAEQVDDPASGAGRHLLLRQPGARVQGLSVRHQDAPNPRLLVRARGKGRLAARLYGPESTRREFSLDDEWTWLSLPLDPAEPSAVPRLAWANGEVSLDSMVFAAGDWHAPDWGETMELPACLFFNAGVMDVDTGALTFRPAWEADSLIMFGPRLPLECGVYTVMLDFTSPAAPGTHLGEFRALNHGSHPLPAQVVAGEPVEITFTQEHNLPVSFHFIYSRNAPLTARCVIIERLD